MAEIFPVILCGGIGSRLWPLSRKAYPKQFLALTSERTMLQETADRVAPRHGFEAPLIVCAEEHRFIAASQLQEMEVAPSAIVLEPEGRNTAPAIAVAALHLAAETPDALMLVLPADHFVQSPEALRAAIAAGSPSAAEGALVTFGVTPTRPDTGYGYIRRGEALGAAYVVDSFVEKPDRETAESYLQSGAYYWNAGIFLFRADRYLDELAKARPEMLAACELAIAGAAADLDFLRLDKAAFLECPSESVDYAVLEASDAVRVVPVDAGWSDIGSWHAVWEIGEADDGGNVAYGDVVLEDCKDCLVRSDGRLTVAVGLEDAMVVETSDAVLVAHRDRAQDVRGIVSRLEAAARPEALMHRRVHRPWGYYETVHVGERHQVKHILINPGGQLSLQLHNHRAEHWVVVRGTARVLRGDDEFTLAENESTYIPVGMRHRLSNPGAQPLSLVEVQSGGYLGEDDIVRFEDIYNRT